MNFQSEVVNGATHLTLKSSSAILLTEATIVPHAAGTIELPGLPLASGYHTRWALPDVIGDTEPPALLPIGQDACHKIVLRVGPDAAAISNGIGLWLRKGEAGDSAPQTGLTLTIRNTDGSDTNLAVPADGKITLAADSAQWQQITSPQGLTVFMNRSATVTDVHELSLQLLKKREWYTTAAVKIGTMNILPVDIAVDADRNGLIQFGVDQTSSAEPY